MRAVHIRAAGRTERLLATGLGLGYAPVAPGTAGSLGSVALFAGLLFALEGALFDFGYLVALAALALVAMWSTKRALPHWNTADPQAIVIDEVLGQWLTFGGLLLAAHAGLGPAARWKSLLAGFILFRFFDVVKPFPIRRCERVPGAGGIVLDDVVAGLYAALGLAALAWVGWLA